MRVVKVRDGDLYVSYNSQEGLFGYGDTFYVPGRIGRIWMDKKK